MRHALAAVVFVLASSAACAGRTSLPAEPDPGAADTSGARAAARLTPQDYEMFETNIGTLYPSMQEHLTAGRAKEAADAAQQIATRLGDVERFWAQQNKPDAVALAQTARTHATNAAGAAAAGDVAKASRTADTLERACNQCHAKYREPDASGGFRVKAGALAPR